MKYLDKLLEIFLIALVFLLPWQTRLIYHQGSISDQYFTKVFEFETYSLYATELLLLLIVMMAVIKLLGNFKRLNFKFKKLNWIIIGLLLWSAISVIWAKDNNLTWYGSLRLAEALVIYWLIINLKIKNIYWKITNSLIVAGTIQAGLGLWQFINQTIWGSKWLGMSTIANADLGASVIEIGDDRWLRAYGALSHPNILGGFLALVLILILINLFKLSSLKIISPKIALNWFFYWLALPIVFFGLIVSFSRGAWLAVCLALGVFLIQAVYKKNKDRLIIILKSSVIFVLILSFIFLLYPSELFINRLSAQGRLEDFSLTERQSGLEQSWSMFKENPVSGVGMFNYFQELRELKPDMYWWQYQPVHNIYMWQLVQLGLIGLGLWLAVMILIIKSARFEFKTLIIMMLIIGLFDHYFMTFYFGLMLWWQILGVSFLDKEKAAQDCS